MDIKLRERDSLCLLAYIIFVPNLSQILQYIEGGWVLSLFYSTVQSPLGMRSDL